MSGLLDSRMRCVTLEALTEAIEFCEVSSVPSERPLTGKRFAPWSSFLETIVLVSGGRNRLPRDLIYKGFCEYRHSVSLVGCASCGPFP
jgi:hypothetical protein